MFLLSLEILLEPHGFPSSRFRILLIFRLSLRPFCCRRSFILSLDVFLMFCLGFSRPVVRPPFPRCHCCSKLWFGACPPSSSIRSNVAACPCPSSSSGADLALFVPLSAALSLNSFVRLSAASAFTMPLRTVSVLWLQLSVSARLAFPLSIDTHPGHFAVMPKCSRSSLGWHQNAHISFHNFPVVPRRLSGSHRPSGHRRQPNSTLVSHDEFSSGRLDAHRPSTCN